MYRIFRQHRIDIDALKYDANSVTVIRNDIDRIKHNPLLYLPSLRKEGAIHLADEIVANGIDELSAPKSPGGDVLVDFDEKQRIISVSDTGRGFPHEMIFDMLEVMNSSAKIGKGARAYTTSTGCFGMGLKITNALSNYMIVISERDGKKIEIRYEHGVRKEVKTSNTKDHGTYIEFQINKKYFEDCDITCQDLMDMIQKKAYVIKSKKVGVVFTGKPKKGNEIVKEYRGLTIRDYIKQFPITSDIIESEGAFGNKTVRMIFGYDANSTEDVIAAAYSNEMYNKSLGSHFEGFLDGMSSYLREYMMNTYLSEKDKKELKLKIDDFKTGLIVAVVATGEDFKYKGGQHKEALDSTEIKNLASRTIKATLRAMDNSKVNKLCAIIKSNCKARQSGESSKQKVKKDTENAFSVDKIPNFTNISKHSTSKFREVFFCEGLSAEGGLKAVADPNSQAIKALRGKVENVYDLPADRALRESKFVSELNKIFNAGIGKNFDINKFNYDRVNLVGDADIDGDGICSEEAAAIAKFFPEIVTSGRLYRVVPPLYEVKQDGKTVFLVTNRELHTLTQHNFAVLHNIYKDGVKLNETDIIDLLGRNEGYLSNIINLSDQHGMSPRLAEFIINNIDTGFTKSSIPVWKKKLSDVGFRFIQVSWVEEYLNFFGMINTEQNDFNYTPEFLEDAKFIDDITDDIYGYTIDDNGEQLSLYQIMAIFDKYKPKIVQRYKGLGQMKSKDLERTVMDINVRHSIRITMEDVDRAFKRLDVLHSKSPKSKRDRKIFMSNFQCDLMSIDT